MCQDILNKRNTDYCGAYELIKHDKLKKECFQLGSKQMVNNYMSGMTRQSENSENEKKKKKQGKLKSITTILSQMNQSRRVDSMALLSETAAHSNKGFTKNRAVVMSTQHLKRLNRINNKFKKTNDYNIDINTPAYQTVMRQNPSVGQEQQNNELKAQKGAQKRTVWLNLPRY